MRTNTRTSPSYSMLHKCYHAVLSGQTHERPQIIGCYTIVTRLFYEDKHMHVPKLLDATQLLPGCFVRTNTWTSPSYWMLHNCYQAVLWGQTHERPQVTRCYTIVTRLFYEDKHTNVPKLLDATQMLPGCFIRTNTWTSPNYWMLLSCYQAILWGQTHERPQVTGCYTIVTELLHDDKHMKVPKLLDATQLLSGCFMRTNTCTSPSSWYYTIVTRLFMRTNTWTSPNYWMLHNCYLNTECNRIRYTNLKIYCDQTDSNITTQFLTQHLLTLQVFVQVFNIADPRYVADIQTIF
jgi:hypothetical protein